MKQNKKASDYFTVVRGAKGKVAEFTLNGEKYPVSGTVVVPREDLEPVALVQMPYELGLDFPEAHAPGFRIHAIQFTNPDTTEVVCLSRFQRSRYVDAKAMAAVEQRLYQLLCQRKDAKILIRHDDGDWILTAFVVTMKGKTFREVFDKTAAWFDKIAAMSQATKSKVKP